MSGCCLGRMLRWELGKTRTITTLHWTAGKRQHPFRAAAARSLCVPNAKADFRETALHRAIENALEVIVWLLLEGADANAKADSGETGRRGVPF